MNRKNDLIRQLLQSTRGDDNLAGGENLVSQAFGLLSAYDIGWADYSNAGGSVNFTPGQWQQVPNDLAGPYTNTASLPIGVDRLMQPGGALDFRQLSIGSLIVHRHDVMVTANNANDEIDMRLRLAIGTALEYTLAVQPPTQLKAASTYQITGMIAFYIGNDETRLNPAHLEIRSGLSGSFVSAGSFVIAAAR